MNESVTSGVLGKLTRKSQFDYWSSLPIPIPIYENRTLRVEYDFDPKTDATFLLDADSALTNFLKKRDSDREELSEPLFRECQSFMELIGLKETLETFKEVKSPEPWIIKDIERIEPLVKMSAPHEVWRFIHPQCIHLARTKKNENEITLKLVCKCDWDDEHGFDILYKNGSGLGLIG